MRSFARHLPHYMALLGLLLAGFAGFTIFSYDKSFQMAVAIATAVAYVLWGVIHHHLHKDLHAETVVEYIAVAALGLVILFTLVIRS
jgi:hypothetical protein